MAWRFVKQPSGLYARFREDFGDFTDVNLSREEAVKLGASIFYAIPLKDAAVLVGAMVDAADQNPERWEAALEEIVRIHGSIYLVGVLDEINGR